MHINQQWAAISEKKQKKDFNNSLVKNIQVPNKY